MTAVELAEKLRELIAQHGDMPVMYDCDALPMELYSIRLFNAPYMEGPIILISPPYE